MPGLEEARSPDRILTAVPAVRREFPHGAGFAAARDYIRLREQAWDAVTAGDPRTALDIAVQCLEEAARIAHRATAELTDAMLQADEAASRQATLAMLRRDLGTERARLQGERREVEAVRQSIEAERHDLIALMAAETRSKQSPPAPAKEKGTRAAHQRQREPLLPDHNAMLRPDPATAGGPVQFMELLRQFRTWAGQPSYRDMAARDQRFTASALHAALKRDVLPRRHEMVDAIVAGCGGSDEDRRIWATAWRRLAMQSAAGVPLAEVLTFREVSEPA
jgi:hypothetical protein